MAVENGATRYTRLPGRGRRLSARFFSGEVQRLYLGGDHVMVVRQTGYEETSKRFYLRDIQAITIQSNSDRAIIAGTLAVLMTAFAGFGFAATQSEDGGPVDLFLYLIAGLLGLWLAVHLALGPSATVRLHTAVQIEELTALRRFRTARRFLRILLPQIEAAQGGWPEGAGASRILMEGSARASTSAQRIREAKPPKVVGRGTHAAAFAFSILFGLSGVAEILYQGAVKNYIDSGLLAVAMLLLLAAAIRQVNSTLPKQTRELVWTLFIMNSVMFMVIMNVATAIAAATNTASGGTPELMYTMDMTVMTANRPVWFSVITAIWGGLNVVIAVYGLLSIRGYALVKPDEPGDPGAPPP